MDHDHGEATKTSHQPCVNPVRHLMHIRAATNRRPKNPRVVQNPLADPAAKASFEPSWTSTAPWISDCPLLKSMSR